MHVIPPQRGRLGARIEGADLSSWPNEGEFAAIYDAYLQHHVISIPGQRLTSEQLLAASRRSGELEPHVLSQYHHPQHPLILVLSNIVEHGKPLGLADAGTYWHSDLSYKARPSRATMLYALEVPDEGGDTLFADLTAAYEALPVAMQRRLKGLRAVHNYGYRSDRLAREAGIRAPLTEAQRQATPDAVHPVVRTHPETGRKAIYINPGFTVRILGLAEADSEALKAELFAHCGQERFILRYRWQAGDVVLWDNAAVMHAATTLELPPHKRRLIWRTIIGGGEPF